MAHGQNKILMKRYDLSQLAGNLKINGLGKIAPAFLNANRGDFNGCVAPAKNEGHEVWDDSSIIALPPDFAAPPFSARFKH
jgi:hypothetical protein